MEDSINAINNILKNENGRLYEMTGKLFLEKNHLQERIEYLEREIRKNNKRIFKKKINL